ncbi:MAG: 50S ribosomal protein L24 [Candidatus Taylorbacteria bacterium]|nr:50S ribosomal protein L24 [Candidatus Taylorbacteria bacterium]
MKIKKNDKVIIIAGKDKGKSGLVSLAIPKKDMVVVTGLNLRKKHQKPRKGGEKGQIIDKAMPIHISNVMVSDPDTKKAVRVGKKLVGERFVRISRRSGKEI